MNYRAPFYAVSRALYSALSVSIGIMWFDAAVPMKEVQAAHKDRAEFCYGVIGQATSDAQNNKDAILWDTATTLEIYSNYKGRKVIAQKLEALLNFFSDDTQEVLEKILYEEGYGLISIRISPMQINQPMYDEIGVWQSGLINLTLKLQQLR